jgi:hypothetical protein
MSTTTSRLALGASLVMLIVLLLGCGKDAGSGPAAPANETFQLTVPTSWVGTWGGTQTLTDCATGESGPESVQLKLCDGESVLDVLELSTGSCAEGSGFSEGRFVIDCTGTRVDAYGCVESVELAGELRRTGSRITGTVRVTTNFTDGYCRGWPEECTNIGFSIERTSTDCGASAHRP